MGDSKHIIVTGGAGFIGSHLVERLLKDGKAVVVIDDLSTGNLVNLSAVQEHPKLRVIPSKVSECKELKDLAREAESIYHLAAAVGVELVMREPVRTLKTNVHETERILEAASEYRVPFLLTSSSEVYGRSDKAEFSEEDDLIIGPPTHPRWGYACSKLMDEFMAMAYARERGLPVIIARLFNTVGPRQTGRYGMVLPRFIEAAKAGKPLQVYGDGRQTRCFCYVLDAVEALVRLQGCADAQGTVFNIGGNEEVNIASLAQTVTRMINPEAPIKTVAYESAYGSDFEDMRRRKPRIRKLHEVTGFLPRTPLATMISKAQNDTTIVR
jgi:UDP-glucose 4-epimerase